MSFPTQLTVLRILLAPVFFVLFAVIDPTPYLWAALVFVVAALSDWYDGYFARLWKLTTPLGAFLDPLADKFLTSAAFIAFASRGLILGSPLHSPCLCGQLFFFISLFESALNLIDGGHNT